jgi:hypothetical protein
MPIFKKGDRRIAFIHVPKAAGSSIERYFTDCGWTMEFYRPCTDPNIPADHHLVYAELKNLVEDLDDIPSFCIVRNPYKRMVSEWRWQRTVMVTTKLNFPDFVRRVEVSLKNSRTYWDNHWRPQSDFLDARLDHVIKIEKLNHGFEEFSTRHDLGFTEPIPRFGKSKFGSFPRLRTDERSMERIRSIYAADFEILGYPTEVPELK